MSEGRAILERLAEKGTSVGPDAVLSAAVAEAERRLTGAQPSREQRSRGPRLLVAAALVVVAALITTLVVRTDDDPRRPIRIEPAVTTTAPVSAEMPRRILVSTSNNGVVVLDSTSGEIVQSLTEPGDDAWGADEIEIDPTGDRWYYASLRRGGGEGPQCDTMRRIASMGFDGSPGEQVAVGSRILISPDGRYLAYRISGGTGTECSGEEARVLDVTTGDEARYAPRTDGQGRWVVPEAFTPDSKGLWVWSAPWTGSVGSDALIDPATGEQLEAVDSDDLAEVLGAVEAVRPLRDGGFVVFDARGEGPGTVAKVSAGQDRDRHALFTTPAGSFPELESVEPSGRHVLVTYYNGILHRWSEGDESPSRLLGNVLDAEWIPDDVELPDPPPPTTTTSTTTPETTDDAWQMLPDAPIAGRRDAAVVWTGTEMIVWGGEGEDYEALDDGAAYDPVTGTWRLLPPATVAGRVAPAAVWTGTEMIVWGGTVDDSGGDGWTYLPDGAAYDPVADEWRTIPDAPITAEFPWEVWTGSEMIVGGRGEGSQSQIAVYVPSLDPGAGSWRAVPVPDEGSLTRPIWTGSEVLIWSDQHDPDNTETRGYAYVAGDYSWRRLADPPPSDGPNDLFPFEPVAWTGEVVIGKRAYGTQAYDPATDTYRDLAGGWGGRSTARVWTGREVVDWGGSELEGDSYLADGTLYDPATDTVTPLPPSPLEGRQSPAAVWTGSEMLVWGGFRGSSAGMSPDAWFADGASYRPPAPVVPVQGDAADPPATIVAVVDGDVVEMDAGDGSVLRTVVAADEEVHATSVLVDRPRGRVFLQGDEGCDGEGNETVWQAPLDGGADPARVTEAFEPSVSADGKWLAAPRHEDGCAAGALVLHEIESGGERIWRDAPGEYLQAEWAPDGHRVAIGTYAGGGGAPDGEIRVLDTQDRYSAFSDMPVLTRGFLRDSVVVDGRWVLAVILKCDHDEDQECKDEVVTVDGDTGERIDSFGEWLWTEDVDLDASGRHALVFAPESTESAYGRTVMYAVEPGGESRRIGPATDADW